jgi:hypothetical protein
MSPDHEADDARDGEERDDGERSGLHPFPPGRRCCPVRKRAEQQAHLDAREERMVPSRGSPDDEEGCR